MMQRQQHNRFKDAPWYSAEESISILVGGAGGIGSWTSLLLARAGFFPIVADFDRIEEHNLGGQLYSKRQIGLLKVTALKDVIKDFSDDTIITMNSKIDHLSPTNNLVVAAFDNMLARTQMFTTWMNEFGNDPEAMYVDGRLNAEQMWIYCIRGGDNAHQSEYFQDKLCDDKEIPDEPCTLKQTSHAAAMIASHIVAFITNHLVNVREKMEIRTVPFEWQYFIPMDLIEVVT